MKFLLSSIEENTPRSTTKSKFKSIFKFLQWKVRKYRDHFTDADKAIIEGNVYNSFFQLTTKSCSYTSKIINAYIESELWSPALRSQYQSQGYANHPIPSCAQLIIPSNVSREREVQLMSLFYKNNLLNDSLYKLGKVPSPLCSSCKQEEETADHILFRCRSINLELHEEAEINYRIAIHLPDNAAVTADHVGLLNASRNQPFVRSCVKIITFANLRSSFIL